MYLLTQDITLYLTVAGTTAMIQHRHKRYVILSLYHRELASMGPGFHWC